MKRSFHRLLVLTLSVSAIAGCSPEPTGSPVTDGAPKNERSDPTASSTESTTATAVGALSNKGDHSSTKSENKSQTGKPVDGNDGVVTKNTGSPPSTSAKAIAMLDLMGMPRIQEKSLLQISPTQLSYTCGSSVTSVDAFYRSELANRKWSEVKGNTPVSDTYLERTFQKDGYTIRYTASEGSSKENTSFFFAHLGNFDVQTLPKPIQVKTQSVPNSTTNATHLSAANIDEIAKDLTEKMLGLGWQRCTESQDSAIDVPHFRSIKFRKEGIRVHLGMARHPDASKNETNVFYHAEPMLPYDVPVADSKESSLMFNPGSFETSLPWKGDRQAMVEWLASEAPRFDWVVEPTEDFVAGKTHGVYVQTSSGYATIVRLVESKGVLSIRFYPTALRKDPKTPEPAKIAGPAPAPNKDSTASTTGPSPEFEAMRAQVDAKIQDELSKALGSIPGAEKKSISELQSQADALLKKMSETREPEDEPRKENSEPKSNPFDVSEDKEPLDKDDMRIQRNSCTIQRADRKYSLEHVVAYTMMEYGKPAKKILLSAVPISEDKVMQMLKRGEAIQVSDVCDPNHPALDVSVWGDSVTINAIVDSTSLVTNSDNLRSTLRYRDGKFTGRVFTKEPLSMGGATLEIGIELNTAILPPASLMAGFSPKNE